MLNVTEREIAVTLASALCDYGMCDHLSGQLEDWVDDNKVYAFGFHFLSGMTKVCITHADLKGWVLKVGFTKHLALDYAKQEYEIYCLAKEAGLEHYFPETEYLGQFNGVPFYVQQEAVCHEEEVSADWYERLNDRYVQYGEEVDSEEIWNIIFDMDDYDKVILSFNDEELADFLRENRVGDLHEGNFGYIEGNLVIVDFSGYRG